MIHKIKKAGLDVMVLKRLKFDFHDCKKILDILKVRSKRLL